MSTSDQDGELASTSDLVNLGMSAMDTHAKVRPTYNPQGIAYELADGPRLLLQSDAAQEVMRNVLRLFMSNLISNDRQAFVKLHCIAIDDLSIELACYFNRKLPAVISTQDPEPELCIYI